jgi:methylenetetrahydrofolate reductase (NADPH)
MVWADTPSTDPAMNDTLPLDEAPSTPGNPFRENLEAGTFSALIEVNTPERVGDFKLGVGHLRMMASALRQTPELPVGLAITDRLLHPESWNVAEFAAELPTAGRNRHALFFSGRNTSLEIVMDTLARCRSAGFQNLVAVSGNGVRSERPRGERMPFADSVNLLNRIRSSEGGWFAGTTVNPFKYTPTEALLQYYKLMKKINQGAAYFITQAGWDMPKLQEARWYIDYRGLHMPALARIVLLSPERVEEICTGAWPGVVISDEFRKLLENEARYGYQQFASAQWRRIQLQVAGCRLLGYSGVVLAGLDRPEHVATACAKIAEALRMFTEFPVWRDACRQHYARTEMAPYPHRFYLFKELLNCAYSDSPELSSCHIPPCSIGEKTRHQLACRILADAHRHAANERLLTKKLLVGCRRCAWCRLPLMQFVCPETCPKGLPNGACGGSRPGGLCELIDAECIHARKLRFANWRKELDQLEERYIRPIE